MSGGKGGAKPSYRPKHTGTLEQMLMAQVMGTMANKNPAMAQAMNKQDPLGLMSGEGQLFETYKKPKKPPWM